MAVAQIIICAIEQAVNEGGTGTELRFRAIIGKQNGPVLCNSGS